MLKIEILLVHHLAILIVKGNLETLLRKIVVQINTICKYSFIFQSKKGMYWCFLIVYSQMMTKAQLLKVQ